jgi:GT2 family glycosyltransferase
MWKKYREDKDDSSPWETFDEHCQHMKDDLAWPEKAENKWKDILIVVRDQLDYFKECIETIQEHTTLYNLLIWDNASGPETQKYIQDLMTKWHEDKPEDWTVEVINSKTNTGFIPPNNALAECATGDYMILINSDCKVFSGWDTAMLGFLQNNPETAQVGYWGGHLSEEGRGFGGCNGYDIDYVPGWCFCISKETYEEFGLFNKQLQFAYCEDADLSLRLQEAGHKIYALYTPLVYHYQNKTIKTVEQEGEVDVRASFKHNHEYIELRWKDYLKTNRVMARRKESHGKQMECAAG